MDTNPLENRLHESLQSYWLQRARRHFQESYLGISMTKFPEDLAVYEHLLWDTAADTVIEVGALQGASALWFRDRLRSHAQYRGYGQVQVVSIDTDMSRARANIARVDPYYAGTISLLEADIKDPSVPDLVASVLHSGARPLVVEDSAHVYETTLAALDGLSRFVPVGSYFVVEDGCVDIEPIRLAWDWPRGVLPAIDDWLRSEQGTCFRQRRDAERYIVTCHPGGFLQRVSESPADST